MIPKGVGPDLPDSLLRAHRSRGAPCVTGDDGQSKGRGQRQKNVFFRALPKSPKPPPPSPQFGQLGPLFFRKSKFKI